MVSCVLWFVLSTVEIAYAIDITEVVLKDV